MGDITAAIYYHSFIIGLIDQFEKSLATIKARKRNIGVLSKTLHPCSPSKGWTSGLSLSLIIGT